MAKISKTSWVVFLWTIVGILWLPIYLAAWILRIVARFLLAISYFGLLDILMGVNVIKSIFVWHDTKI